MPEQSGQRDQQASPRRRRQAREKGQVAKSQDLASAAILIIALGTLLFFGAAVVDHLGDLAARYFGSGAWLTADKSLAVHEFRSIMAGLAIVLLPMLGIFMLAAILANLFQTGFLFVPGRVAPDLNRIDPVKGLARLFSLSSLARLGFGVLKIIVIACTAAWCLYQRQDEIMGLVQLELPQIAVLMADLILWTSLKIGGALLVIAMLDYAFQRWKHEQDLKMTTQEVREELKNMQGNSTVSARRRTVQRQLVLDRLAAMVPKADVLITNPTELAVAVRYDPKTSDSPVVVAKGDGIIAQQSRQLALEHGIPIVERKPLARALYKEVEINQPIPSDHYPEVAEVLAYVYQLNNRPLPSLNAA